MSIAKDGPRVHVPNLKLREFPETGFEAPNRPILSRLHALNPGEAVLEASQFSNISEDGLVADFVLDEERARGRNESAHGVSIWQVVLQSVYDQEIPITVAAKPYASNLVDLPFSPAKTLVHEWAANEHVSRLSSYERSYLPIGMWKREDGTPNLLTLFDESTQSFDNIFWAKGDEVEKMTPQRIEKAWRLGMYAMGVLHGAGLTHGDAQVKNFARDTRRVRFIDLTSLRTLPLDDSKSKKTIDVTDRNLMKIDLDIKEFLRSSLDENHQSVAMRKRVLDVFMNKGIAASVLRNYQHGLKQGGERSGVVLPRNLRITKPQYDTYIAEAIDPASQSHRVA